MSNGTHPVSYDFDCTTRGICERVAVNLNDATPGDENQRWSLSFIKSAVKDAFAMMAELVPTAFSQDVEWYLEAGKCTQKLPPDCGRLIEIVCIIDEDSGDEVTLSEVSDDLIARNSIYPARCKGCGSSNSTPSFQYSISANADSIGFTPNPDDENRYRVEAKCADVAKIQGLNENDQLPSTLRPWMGAIVALVTGLMLMRNRDDPNLIAQSEMYIGRFSLLTNLALSRVQSIIAEES